MAGPTEPTAPTTPAPAGRLILAWPQARLAVNTPDKLELAMGEVAAGLKSHLMLVQDWYGVGRDEALELIDQIRKDEGELTEVHPELAAIMKARMMPQGPGGDDDGDQAGDDPAEDTGD